MKIVLWQNMPSLHLSPLIYNLSLTSENTIICVFEKKIYAYREKMGWYVPDLGKTRMLYFQEIEQKENKCLFNDAESYHVFCGLFSISFFLGPFRKLIRKRAKIVFLTECGNATTKVKKYLSNIKWFTFLKVYDKHILAYLAMGRKGVNFYNSLGVGQHKIYPFAYQVNNSYKIFNRYAPCQNDKPLRLLYIGQFQRRKGIDILLNALSLLKECNITLDLIGHGPEMVALNKQANALNIANKLKFLGMIKNSEINSYILQYDCLVIPSRHDGWAAVTNEAIQCGIPAIVSDGAGSVDLVDSTGAGRSFHSGNYIELSKIIKTFYDKPELLLSCHDRCKLIAQSISGESLSNYLKNILMYLNNSGNERPVAPWESFTV